MVPGLVVDARGVKLATSGATPAPTRSVDAERLRKAAEDFEAVFIAEMLRPMTDGLGAETPFGGGFAEDMWRSTLVDEYGKAIARNGGLGIADAVARELLRLQQSPGPTTAPGEAGRR